MRRDNKFMGRSCFPQPLLSLLPPPPAPISTYPVSPHVVLNLPKPKSPPALNWCREFVSVLSCLGVCVHLCEVKSGSEANTHYTRGGVAWLVQSRTGTPLWRVRFTGAARDFSPRVSCQCRLSYGVHTAFVCNSMLEHLCAR